MLFFSVYRSAIIGALEDKLPDPVMHAFLKQRYSTNVADLWFEDQDHVVWDDVSTEEREGRGEVVREAFRREVARLRRELGSDPRKWRWGARHFLELAPHARYADVSGAGHMVAGDRNDHFSAAVLSFIGKLPTAA